MMYDAFDVRCYMFTIYNIVHQNIYLIIVTKSLIGSLSGVFKKTK
jgi:hypothetical protein